jgi:biopolymer transport protein ExbD/biopolymer transport protein TolR
MKTINIYRLSAVALLAFLLFPTACFYKRSAVAKQASAIPNLPQGIAVDFPGDLENAEVDVRLLRETAVIVSIPSEQQLYLGHDLTPKDQISSQLGELLKRRQPDSDKAALQPYPDPIVYLAAGAGIGYGVVVDVLNFIRKQDVKSVGLIAGRKHEGDNSSQSVDQPRRLLVNVPAVPNEKAGLPTLLPNPLTLVVSISPDLKLRLNNKEGPEQYEPCYGLTTTYGSVNDPGPLVRCLTQLFKLRREQHAYRPGFETRSDLVEDERVEKTTFVKAPRSIKYGAVVHVIDAVKGSGAYPISLQIDDLPQ